MQTSKRASDGANIIKGFDIYDDPTKLKPLTDIERFNTEDELNLGIVALGGTSQADETVLGLGNAMSNWLGVDWEYRVKLEAIDADYLGLDNQVDESGESVEFGWDDQAGYAYKIAQPFTAASSSTDGVILYKKADTDPWTTAETVTIGIQADSAGAPSGTFLGSQTFTNDSPNKEWNGLLDDDEIIVDFDSVSTTISNTYWVVAEFSGTSEARLNLGAKIADSGETKCYGYNSSDGWFEMQYRLYFQGELEPVMNNSSSYGYIDLGEVMPAGFWSTVSSDGNDIRLTDSNHEPLKFNLKDFSQSAETGKLIFKPQLLLQDLYLYYGNSKVDSASGSYTDLFSSSVTHGFPLDGNLSNFVDLDADLDNGDAYVAASTTPTIGQGLGNGSFDVPSGTASAFTGNHVGYSFLWNISNYPSSQQTILSDESSWYLKLESTGRMTITLDTVGGGIDTFNAGADSVIPRNQWNHVAGYYSDTGDTVRLFLNGKRVFINGGIANGDLDGSTTTFDFYNDASGGIADASAEFLVISTDPPSERSIRTQYNMVFDSVNTFIAGAVEQKSGQVITNTVTSATSPITYDGAQLYTKELSDSAWSDYLSSGLVVKDLDYYPVPAFITGTTPNFIVTETQSFKDSQQSMYLASPASFSGTLLSALSSTSESMPRYSYALDGNTYYTEGQSTLSIMGGAADVFTAASTINHTTPYGQYLAVAADQNNTSFVQLWDFADIVAEDIDFGFGRIRAVGNIGGVLFGMINNDINQGELANGRRSMDIKLWQGGSFAEPFYSMESATSFEGYYTYGYQQPILNQVEYTDNGFSFYARTADQDGSVHEGIWAVGKNEQSRRFGVSVPYDTSSAGDIDFIYRTGKVMLMVGNDGKIWKTSDSTHTNTSSWESNLFAGSDRENVDKLRSIEVTFEPLASGQTISVYYKKEGEGSWTLLDTEATANATSMEITKNTAGGNMPGFKEIQFKLTSTGGDSAITSFGFTYEDTLDNS